METCSPLMPFLSQPGQWRHLCIEDPHAQEKSGGGGNKLEDQWSISVAWKDFLSMWPDIGSIFSSKWAQNGLNGEMLFETVADMSTWTTECLYHKDIRIIFKLRSRGIWKQIVCTSHTLGSEVIFVSPQIIAHLSPLKPSVSCFEVRLFWVCCCPRGD